jgi:hypothetical protein
MKRQPIESSTVRAIGYDPATGVLEVEFLHGLVYEYAAVSKEVHSAFMAASSKGSFFHTEIKGAYDYKKVEGAGDEKGNSRGH